MNEKRVSMERKDSIINRNCKEITLDAQRVWQTFHCGKMHRIGKMLMLETCIVLYVDKYQD